MKEILKSKSLFVEENTQREEGSVDWGPRWGSLSFIHETGHPEPLQGQQHRSSHLVPVHSGSTQPSRPG